MMNEVPHEFLRRLGDTPWSAEDVHAAFQHLAELAATPHDDWDRSERGVNWIEQDGTPSRLILNPDAIENQIGAWLAARCQRQGLSDDVRRCHMWRFFEIIEFLQDNEAVLIDHGLILTEGDDPANHVVSDELLTVLATARYEGVRLHAGDPAPSFHVQRVLEAAKALRANDE